MPTRARVEEFIDRMKKNESLELMEDFYAADATAQENNSPPRVGLEALVAAEKMALARSQFENTAAPDVVIDGDTVVIHWVFDIHGPFDVHWKFDELALQHWRGDKIARERFFYDPAQRPKPPAK